MRVLRPAVLLCLAVLIPGLSRAAADAPDDNNTVAVATSGTASSDAAAAPAQPARPQSDTISTGRQFAFGVGVKVSTLGIGGEVAFPVMSRINIRAGVNAFNYSPNFTESNISYAGSLKFLSAQATADVYLFGSFHISPGALLYNNNHIDATATIAGSNSFTLNSVSYVSDPTNPAHGTASVNFMKVAPMLLMGFGNLVPRSASRHFSISAEVGAVYEGSPKINLSLAGNVCTSPGVNCRSIAADPTVQSNVQAEQTNLVNKANPFKYYPVVALGFGWKF